MEPIILVEDDDVLVLNKPSGMTVNRAGTTSGETTLQDWVEDYRHLSKHDPKVSDTYDSEEVFKSRAGIVHRLDKETSGVIIVAKNVQSFEDLQKQFKERLTKKVYRALSHGRVEPADGEINAPIGRLPWNRMRFGVLPDGREAVTKYHVLSHLKNPVSHEEFSFIELYPQTGRTHQLRVHLKHIGYPIFGDFLYGGRKTSRDDRALLPRVFLHAFQISFSHPTTKDTVTTEAPLPAVLSEFLEKIIKP